MIRMSDESGFGGRKPPADFTCQRKAILVTLLSTQCILLTSCLNTGSAPLGEGPVALAGETVRRGSADGH